MRATGGRTQPYHVHGREFQIVSPDLPERRSPPEDRSQIATRIAAWSAEHNYRDPNPQAGEEVEHRTRQDPVAHAEKSGAPLCFEVKDVRMGGNGSRIPGTRAGYRYPITRVANASACTVRQTGTGRPSLLGQRAILPGILKSGFRRQTDLTAFEGMWNDRYDDPQSADVARRDRSFTSSA